MTIVASMSRWTDAEGADELVARLSGEGHSAREIADQVSVDLGFAVTRNAVIGRMSRQRLNSFQEARMLVVTPPPPRPEPPVRPTGNEKRFRKIGPKDCRFILGDVEGFRTMMCGNPILDGENSAWCPYCRKVVYTQRTK